MEIKEFKNGACVLLERGVYTRVVLRDPRGEIHDKIICDTYKMAREYFRAFCAIAKNL